MLAKQSSVLASLSEGNGHAASADQSSVQRRAEAVITKHTEACLASLLRVSAYYAGKFAPDERSVSSVMRRIAEEVGKDGVVLSRPNESGDNEAIMQAETAFERLL